MTAKTFRHEPIKQGDWVSLRGFEEVPLVVVYEDQGIAHVAGFSPQGYPVDFKHVEVSCLVKVIPPPGKTQAAASERLDGVCDGCHQSILDAARDYVRTRISRFSARHQQRIPHGVVFFWDSEPFAWYGQSIERFACCPANEFCPGTFCVDTRTGRVCFAVGGNDTDGADRWQALPSGFRVVVAKPAACSPQSSTA